MEAVLFRFDVSQDAKLVSFNFQEPAAGQEGKSSAGRSRGSSKG